MDHRRSSPARWFPRPVPGGGAVGYYVPFGWSGLFRCLGAQRPGGPAYPAGVPISPEKWGERGPGASPLDPRFYSPLVPTRSFWRLWRIVPVEGLLRAPCTCPDLERFFVLVLNSMRVGPFPSAKPPLPARPAGGRAVTGVRYRAAGQAEKKRGPPQGPPNQKRWVQGGRTSSSLVFFPPAFFQRKPGPRPGPGGQRGAAPRGWNEPRTWRVRSTAPHPHPAGSNLRRSQKGPPTDSRGPRPHLGPLGPPNVFGDIRQRPGDLHLIPPALGQVP